MDLEDIGRRLDAILAGLVEVQAIVDETRELQFTGWGAMLELQQLGGANIDQDEEQNSRLAAWLHAVSAYGLAIAGVYAKMELDGKAIVAALTIAQGRLTEVSGGKMKRLDEANSNLGDARLIAEDWIDPKRILPIQTEAVGLWIGKAMAAIGEVRAMLP